VNILLNSFYLSELNKARANTYPLGLLSISAYVKNRIKDVNIKIIDGCLEMDDIKAFEPDLIGISLLSPFFTKGAKIAKEIKKNYPEIPVIIGGHHITYIPGNLPKECDAGVLGEGEVTFYEICKLLMSKGSLHADDLDALKGIVYWKNNILKINDKKNDVLEPDQIPPLTNYDLCEFKNKRQFSYHVIASRGCPYKCLFCSSSPFWRKVRYYNVNNVVSQVKYIVDNFHPGMVNFYDDLMIANISYLKLLQKGIISNGLHKKTRFTCWVAGRHFNEEVAHILKEMNVSLLSFGVESGSPLVYEYLKGTWNSPDKNAQAISLANSMGFEVGVSVIVGAPPETVSDLKQTYTYLKNLSINSGMVGLLKPFPGTALWEYAKEKKIVCDDMDDWCAIESDDILNPQTLFLGEKASRKETQYYYDKIQQLLNRKRMAFILKNRLRKAFIPGYWVRILRRAFKKTGLKAQ
jgi:anaerobic magnesium-protoporphyrin IX monomethyl ester cyclase